MRFVLALKIEEDLTQHIGIDLDVYVVRILSELRPPAVRIVSDWSDESSLICTRQFKWGTTPCSNQSNYR